MAGSILAISLQSLSRQTPAVGSATEIVNLTVTVTDKDGRVVRGLKADDFALYEDDRPRTIARVSPDAGPLSLAILFDVGVMMSGNQMMPAAQSGIGDLLRGLRPADELLLAEFSVGMRRLTQGWTQDRNAIQDGIARLVPKSELDLSVSSGAGDALAVLLPTLTAGRYSRRAVLVVSVALPGSGGVPAYVLRRMLREVDLTVYVLGIDATQLGLPCAPCAATPVTPPSGSTLPRFAPSVLAIASETGGWVQTIGPGEVTKALKSLSSELTGQYLVAYERPLIADGRWHSIRVDARGGSLNVQNRTGFMAK